MLDEMRRGRHHDRLAHADATCRCRRSRRTTVVDGAGRVEAGARRAQLGDAGRALRVSGRPVHAARSSKRSSAPATASPTPPARIGDRAASRADHRAAAALGGLVGRRRRAVLAGDPRLPGARSLAAGAHVRPRAPRMSDRRATDHVTRARRFCWSSAAALGLVVVVCDRARAARACSTRRSSAPTSSSS